jgi:cytoskeletal protein RodZ
MALEEDRYANLSPIYVKSFLSAYAECLGLDPSQVIIVHQENAGKLSFSKDRGLNPLPAIRSKRPQAWLLVFSVSVVLLMALIGYALFIQLR